MLILVLVVVLTFILLRLICASGNALNISSVTVCKEISTPHKSSRIVDSSPLLMWVPGSGLTKRCIASSSSSSDPAKFDMTMLKIDKSRVFSPILKTKKVGAADCERWHVKRRRVCSLLYHCGELTQLTNKKLLELMSISLYHRGNMNEACNWCWNN